MQPDAGPHPHPAAWPESLKETKHNPFTLGGIISTGPQVEIFTRKSSYEINETKIYNKSYKLQIRSER
jgi:hypothetical protein